MLTEGTAGLVSEYFTSHPGLAAHLLTQIEAEPGTPSVCSDPTSSGCTNPAAYNFNPLVGLNDGSCLPTVYGCTEPLAINYNPVANTYDNTGVLGERCRAVRCGTATGPVPSCPAGGTVPWEGPMGGLCVRHIGATEESTPWVCQAGEAMVEYGVTGVSHDECAVTPGDPVSWRLFPVDTTSKLSVYP